MSSILTDEKKKNMFRKRKYYNAHPNEATTDHIKQIKIGNDDFIMEKVEKWEKSEKRGG